jgi:hypothetical protein
LSELRRPVAAVGAWRCASARERARGRGPGRARTDAGAAASGARAPAASLERATSDCAEQGRACEQARARRRARRCGKRRARPHELGVARDRGRAWRRGRCGRCALAARAAIWRALPVAWRVAPRLKLRGVTAEMSSRGAGGAVGAQGWMPALLQQTLYAQPGLQAPGQQQCSLKNHVRL